MCFWIEPPTTFGATLLGVLELEPPPHADIMRGKMTHKLDENLLFIYYSLSSLNDIKP
jgi:hypothetical protein